MFSLLVNPSMSPVPCPCLCLLLGFCLGGCRLFFTLRLSFGGLPGGFENLFGGQDNWGDAVAHIAGAAPFQRNRASDENPEDVTIKGECRRARHGCGWAGLGNEKLARPFDHGADALRRCSAGSPSRAIQS